MSEYLHITLKGKDAGERLLSCLLLRKTTLVPEVLQTEAAIGFDRLLVHISGSFAFPEVIMHRYHTAPLNNDGIVDF